MGNRLTKVYTRTGDQGSTGMADGSRRPKNDPRVHCMGEIDELNTCIGMSLSLLEDGSIQQLLFAVQHDLFDIGAELCQPGKQLITSDYVDSLEASADDFNAGLSDLKEFILPGGSQTVASLQTEAQNPFTCQYINRLSDLLFILARAQSQAEGGGEVYWNSKYSRLNRGD
jgi:cob(I)alamin adenosyltransferase